MKNNIEVGIGRACITPTTPLGLAGYFNLRMWEEVLDDIEVRVIIFRQDDKYFTVIQYDLICVSKNLLKKTLTALKNAGIYQIDSNNSIFTATHTHTAPEIRPERKGFESEYIDFAAQKTVEAVKKALNDFEQCSIYETCVKELRFSFNRRFWMKNGEVITNPGKLNPDIIRPEGEIDPEIPLLCFKSNENIKALIVNIVNHADTTGGSKVSADWPGHTIRQLQNNAQIVVPIIGCSGNINHFDIASSKPQTSPEEAQRIGQGYAESIRKGLKSLTPVDSSNIKTFCSKFEIQPRKLSADEVAEAKRIIKKYHNVQVDFQGGPDLTAEDLAKKTPFALKYFAICLLKNASEAGSQSINLTGISFGKNIIVSLPNEPFTEIGLRIKKASGTDKNVMIASLANGSGTGYIPNIWNYGRGGYETTPRSNPFALDTSELLINKILEKIKTL